MTYVDGVTIPAAPSAGTAGTYAFRANSIYDPDLSGAGHQPMGRDVWASLYNHYLVLSARITVTFTPTVTSGVAFQTVGIILHEDGTLSSSALAQCCEQGKSTYRTYYPALGFNSVSLSHTFDARRWFGIQSIEAAIYNIGAAVNTSPADTAAFVLFGGSFTSATSGINVAVTLTQTVLFTEPIEQPSN